MLLSSSSNNLPVLGPCLFTWMSELFSSVFHSVTFKFVAWKVPFPITSLREEPTWSSAIQFVSPLLGCFMPRHTRVNGVDQKLLSFVSVSLRLIPAASLYATVLFQYSSSYLNVCCYKGQEQSQGCNLHVTRCWITEDLTLYYLETHAGRTTGMDILENVVTENIKCESYLKTGCSQIGVKVVV